MGAAISVAGSKGWTSRGRRLRAVRRKPWRLGNSARWPDLAEEPGGLARGDLVWHPTGNQLADHGVQPAGALVAGPGKITMPFGPHLQHAGVVIVDHLPPKARHTRAGRRFGSHVRAPR